MQSIIRKAFTLIELLVVIAIIGILSGLIVVSMNGITQKATIAKAQVFSNSLRNSLMMNIAGEWKFDDGSGTTAADSWAGNTGTLRNFSFDASDGWRSGSACVYGGCLQLGGGTEYIDVADTSNLRLNNDFTISFWASRTGSTAYNYPGILIKGDSSSANGYLIYYSESNGAINFKRNNVDISWSSPLSINSGWKYYVVTYNSSQSILNFYANGVLSRPGGYSTAFPVSAGTTNLKIGTGDAGPIYGLLDEIRFFNAVLPTSQIKEQYCAGLINLLVNGSISQEEYASRILDLNNKYAKR